MTEQHLKVREYSHQQLRRYESRNAASGSGFILMLILLSMVIAGCLIGLTNV